MKKLGIGVLIFITLLTLLPSTLWADSRNRNLIRIGYVEGNPFIRMTNGVWSGYGVEYLNKVAEYTGWEYEYICLQTDELETKILNQEVDFIFVSSGRTASFSELRKSEFFIAYENYAIYVKDNSDIYYEDYAALNLSEIGVVKDAVNVETINSFLTRENVSFTLRTYETQDELYQALDNGEVKAICHGSLQEPHNVRQIARFGAKEYYGFTSAKNKALMQTFNYAVECMKYDTPSFEGETYEYYFGHSQFSDTPIFTRTETDFIENSDVITVRILKDNRPLSFVDGSGQTSGVLVELLRLIENKSGLKFEIVLEDEQDGLNACLANLIGTKDLRIYSKYAIEQSPYYKDLSESISITTTELAYVRRKTELSDHGRKDYRLAMARDYEYMERVFSEYSSELTLLYYDDSQKAVEAVLRGDADIALMDDCIADFLLQKPIYEERLVEYSGYDWTNEICMVGDEEQQVLLDIINKCIRHASRDELENLKTKTLLLHPYQYSFVDFVYKYHNILLLTTFMIVVALVIYTISVRNITRTRANMREYVALKEKVQLDELTGLYNRPYFYSKAKEMIQSSEEEWCIVLLNVVNYQMIMDLYGMENGEKLLKEIANEIRRLGEGKHMIAGRFNSDRFYLCLPTKEFYDSYVPSHFFSRTVHLDVSINYGVFLVENQKDISISQMCSRAAIAAHKKDQNGVGYIRYYSEDEHSRMVEEQEIENDMKHALEERQFCIYVQPKYDIESHMVVGGEALVRWKHPEKGMISPNAFIPVFEKNGFITELDYYIWEEACRCISQWKRQGILRGPISVNVSRVHFYNSKSKDRLLQLVSKHRIEPKDLQLEITETVCAEENGIVFHAIEDYRRCGFAVAMDDFGSGYSSLNMLKDIPLDVIKMDLKFLDDTSNKGRSRYILKTLIRLAKNLGLEVVVEGVETEEQARFLAGIGGVYAQGYYFSKPVEVDIYRGMMVGET